VARAIYSSYRTSNKSSTQHQHTQKGGKRVAASGLHAWTPVHTLPLPPATLPITPPTRFCISHQWRVRIAAADLRNSVISLTNYGPLNRLSNYTKTYIKALLLGVSANPLVGIAPTERIHLFAIFSSLTGDKPAAAIRVEELNLITIYGTFTLV